MKIFKQLTIGDSFYKVYTDYRGKEKVTFTEIKVRGIEISEKQKINYLVINKRITSYNDSVNFSLELEKCETDFIETTNDGFYTTDYNKVVKLLKNTALKYIQEYEEEIKQKEKAIENIRVLYWDYLNDLVTIPIEPLTT